MSSALKPVLAPTGTQSPAAGAPPGPAKPQVMAQHAGAPGPYATGPLGHVPQNLGGLPHPHGNMGLSAPNMAMNTMPNLSQMGMNQPPAHNMQAAHNNPIKTQNLPSAPAVAGRPTHPYLSGGSAPPGPPQDEGTTLPPSQNSAQLMAVHRAQQQNQHVNQNQQHHDQPAHSAQPITPDRFKPQPPQVIQQPPVPQQQQQQVQQQPQIPQQPPTLPSVQSNGTVSAPETNNKITVPTPPTETKTDSTASTPAVQNHVAEINNDTSNAKQPENSIGNAVPQPAPEQKPAVAATPEQPPPPEVPQAATTPTKIAAVPKEERVVPVVKPPSTMKLATTPVRATSRKRETKKVESPKTSPSKTPDGKSSGAQNNRPPDKAKTPRTPSEERKSKRTRTRTQPYQSPLPELALISKLSNSAASPSKAQDEKLIVFYKNEFLAVRNAEGGFYVCQAVQNVYKSSLRIRIRWLSQDKQDKIYIPDFYDTTDFDCILTNLNMERVEKGKYNLPKDELERTENILKRALAVESGEATPSLTEEHPDGLDLSLFRDESQLKKKRRSSKRKSSSPTRSPSKRTKRTPDKSKSRKPSKSPAPKIVAKRNNQSSDRKSTSIVNSAEKKVEPVKIIRKSDGGRAERAKRRGEAAPPTPVKTSPVVDQKKARVLAKVAMKTAIPAATPQKKKAGRNTPTGNGKSASAAPKIGVKATRASSQSTPAPSTPAASASTSRRAKKTKK